MSIIGETVEKPHNHYALPPQIESFFGKIVDMDGHENLPLSFWDEEYGAVSKLMQEAMRKSGLPLPEVDPSEDDVALNSDTVFKKKLWDAPGNFDLARRVEVLDYVGTEKQIIYPGGFGSMAGNLYLLADQKGFFPIVTGDRRAYARQLLDAHNDWCIRARRSFDRLLPVAILIGETVDELVADAKRLIDGGVRHLMVSASTPLAGYSPAHNALDPLWALMESGGAVLLNHVGIDQEFLKTQVWREASAFEGFKFGQEFALDPWTLSTVHLATQNFLSCLVLGGVFQRFPKLMFGSSEYSAHWIGPLAFLLDFWNENDRKFAVVGGSNVLKMKPSEYIRRNVRLSPFDIEDVAKYIERYGLKEVYCYASDFPHVEGGKQPIEDFVDNLDRLGPEVLRAFFTENARAIMPD